MSNISEEFQQDFRHRLENGLLPVRLNTLTPGDCGLSGEELVDLFETQLMSRHLDLMSRRLRARNESFYTIGSAGHEGNAVLGKAFRVDDMAFLHYRSCPLLIQRAKQRPGETPLYDILLSFAASSDDPVSGGRHKVLGSHALRVPPQTSTIASHLPKAMGMAHAIALAKQLGYPHSVVPHDSVVLCTFGDASANHSTTLGAINSAAWAAYQGARMPIVFVCEDNGIGISTTTPPGWIAASWRDRKGLQYRYADGLDLLDTWRGAIEAVDLARSSGKPVFLHLRTLRLMGHAGSDVESKYRAASDIESERGQDPLFHSARLLLDHDILDAAGIDALSLQVQRRIERIAEIAITRPKLKTADEVMSCLVAVPGKTSPPAPVPESKRQLLFRGEQRLLDAPQNMARLINLALADLMAQYDHMVVCGEDVGTKGGVYSVTTGLRAKFGKLRVIDTPLDEQTILGLALGLAHNGFLPVPEIQFLAYVHNAEDQIRGEAATLPFFSRGKFSNPMVLRIAGLAYQKGFGGHFHNDNSFAVFRDIPGLVIACPSNGDDAVQMLRTCMDMAERERRVVIFLEPIALYMTRDLHQPGDDLWASVYQPPGQGDAIQPGQFARHGDGRDLCIVSYGNGYYLSRQAAKRLEDDHGVALRVVDLRWMAPLDQDALCQVASECRAILIVDECRRTGSISEALVTLFTEGLRQPPAMARVTARDSFIPLADAANLVLPGVEDIVEAALRLCTTPEQGTVE